MSIRIQKNKVDKDLYNQLFELFLPTIAEEISPKLQNETFYANMIFYGCYLYVGENVTIEIDIKNGKVLSITKDRHNYSGQENILLLNKILECARTKLLKICLAHKLMEKFKFNNKRNCVDMNITICNICGDIVIGGCQQLGLKHIIKCHITTRTYDANDHFIHKPANYTEIMDDGQINCIICGKTYETLKKKDLKAINTYNYCSYSACTRRQYNSYNNMLWNKRRHIALSIIKDHMLNEHSDPISYKKMHERFH